MPFSRDPDAVIPVGATGQAARTVRRSDTAIEVGSGTLPVLATPIMIALMEAAACDALAGHLPSGATSVGSHMDVRHLAPSAVGTPVTATARIIEVKGARVVFEVHATHESGGETVEIGAGTHTRVIVRPDGFPG